MKKLMSVLLTLAMLCSFAVVPVSAETTLSTEVGEDGKTYYLIGSADDYVAFVTAANADLSINGKLTADIDMSGVAAKSIGIHSADSSVASSGYTGVFDGNKHVIKNLSISRKFSANKSAAIAMFNRTDGATIKDLGLENAVITNTGAKDGVYLGGIVGGAGNSSTISGCYVKNSTITSTQVANYINRAGSIGAYVSSSSKVINCYATGNTIGYTTKYTGETSVGASVSTFIGVVDAKTTADCIENCYSRGNVLKSLGKTKNAGFIRVGTSGNTDLAFLNSYTDTLTGFDAKSSMTKYAKDAAEWSTLADTLGSAFKNDTYNLNGGAPRLSWEADPSVYTVTVADGIVNGSVSVDKTEAGDGATVTLTVTPESDLYKVAEVTVNGEAIASPYTFTMPKEDVTVNATFTKRWANGEGTKESPIIISEIAELDELRKAVNAEKHFDGVYFELANDLDFSGVEFGTIGQVGSDAQRDARWFSGSFDGKNHVIKNLTINTSQRYVALFGIIKKATIKNLGIEDSYFRQQGNYFAAGIAGLANNSEISGCFVKNTSVIIKSEVSGEAKNSQSMAGLIAEARGTTSVTNCYAKNVDVLLNYETMGLNGAAGGLVGYLAATSSIANSYTSEIKFNMKTSGNVAYMAREYGENTITNSYVTAKAARDTASVNVIDADSDEWLTLADKLGNAFKNDTYGANGGRPFLAWEDDSATAYSVIISDSITNGTVKANYEKAVEGATVRLSVVADENATLESVTVNGEALEAPYTFTMPANDVTINAVFTKQNTYAVNIADTTGGKVSADVETASVGATVALTVTPESDLYKVTSVTVNGEAIASPYTFEMPEGDVTVNATFAKRWANGEGTEESPIIISEIAELDELRKAVNAEKHFEGVYFELTNDLDFTGVETFGTIGQVGSDAQRDARWFSGSFDGKNHVIKNLTINTSQRYVALFGIIKKATIKNLGIEDSYFRQQGHYFAASLAVVAANSVVSNCYVKDTTVRIKSELSGEGANSQSMGGLIAEAQGTTSVSDCYAKNVTIALDYSSMSLNSAAGGLVGKLESTASIANSYTAQIKFNMNTSGNVAYMAREYGENTITNSYVTAKAARDNDSVTLVTEKELRAASLLGEAFVADVDMVNGGLPMLKWEETAQPNAKFIFAGFVTTEDGAVSGVKLEKYDSSSLTAKAYAVVKEGDSLKKVVVADVNTATKGNNTVTFGENISLGENEILKIYVWDNDVNPLMYIGE